MEHIECRIVQDGDDLIEQTWLHTRKVCLLLNEDIIVQLDDDDFAYEEDPELGSLGFSPKPVFA